MIWGLKEELSRIGIQKTVFIAEYVKLFVQNKQSRLIKKKKKLHLTKTNVFTAESV